MRIKAILSEIFLLFLVACASNNLVKENNFDFIESTNTLSPTSTIVLNSTPTITKEYSTIFSVDTFNSNPPEDIFQHIYFSGSFGGGALCDYADISIPGVLDITETVEIMQGFILQTCWKPNEVVELEITTPKNKIIKNTLIADETGELYSSGFYAKLDDPMGKYTFSFSGESGTLSVDVEVVLPAEPRLYEQANRLVLLNYPLNEKLRLFAYQDDELLGWDYFIVDENGHLEIEIDVDATQYFTVGDNSGLVFSRPENWALFDLIAGHYQLSCPGSMSPVEGIQLGGMVEIISPNAYIIDGDEQIKISEGSKIKITDTFFDGNIPDCLNGVVMWPVSYSDFYNRDIPEEYYKYLYLPEGVDGDYFIRPIDDNEEIEIILTDQKPIENLTEYYPLADCAASRLYVGDQVILETGIDYVSIRNTPDTHPSDNRIGRIDPGESAEIIAGPKCNYGWVLWKVENSDGLVGWVPETDGNEFWLVSIE